MGTGENRQQQKNNHETTISLLSSLFMCLWGLLGVKLILLLFFFLFLCKRMCSTCPTIDFLLKFLFVFDLLVHRLSSSSKLIYLCKKCFLRSIDLLWDLILFCIKEKAKRKKEICLGWINFFLFFGEPFSFCGALI